MLARIRSMKIFRATGPSPGIGARATGASRLQQFLRVGARLDPARMIAVVIQRIDRGWPTSTSVAFVVDSTKAAAVAVFDFAETPLQPPPCRDLIRQIESQSLSTWSMRWVENRIDFPAARSPTSTSFSCIVLTGSRPRTARHHDEIGIVQQRRDELDLLACIP